MSQNLELGMKRGVRVQIEGAEVEQEPWLVYTDQSATPPPRKRRSSDQDTDKNSDACHKVCLFVFVCLVYFPFLEYNVICYN